MYKWFFFFFLITSATYDRRKFQLRGIRNHRRELLPETSFSKKIINSITYILVKLLVKADVCGEFYQCLFSIKILRHSNISISQLEIASLTNIILKSFYKEKEREKERERDCTIYLFIYSRLIIYYQEYIYYVYSLCISKSINDI